MWTVEPAEELVYGIPYNGADVLVVIPERRAVDLTDLRSALEGATTWDEFMRQAPPHRVQEVLALFDEDESAPRGDDAFHRDDLPGYSDGDWPEWPAQCMLDWLPADARCLGAVDESVINGSYLRIPLGAENELVAALNGLGFPCRRDDGLVARASGH